MADYNYLYKLGARYLVVLMFTLCRLQLKSVYIHLRTIRQRQEPVILTLA